ncbi:MAG TPA: hypothetical protein VNB29_08255, partial [Chthoniobacterales bacterium]|nr:hypothetical protein [Chthoniobacterales bacterium]
RKCLKRLFEMRANGMSLIMVHHSPGMLLSIAETALYLRKGKAVDFGEVAPVVQQYERDLVKDMAPLGPAGEKTESDGAEGYFASSDAELIDVIIESDVENAVTSGKDAVVRAHFKIMKPITQLNFTATISRMPSMENVDTKLKPQQVIKMISRRDGGSLSNVAVGEYEVRIELPSIGLRDGIYQIGLRLSCPPRIMLASRNSLSFLVSSDDVTPSEYYQRRAWSVVSRDGSLLHTEKFLNTVETADDILDLEQKSEE